MQLPNTKISFVSRALQKIANLSSLLAHNCDMLPMLGDDTSLARPRLLADFQDQLSRINTRGLACNL